MKIVTYKVQFRHSDQWITDYIGNNETVMIQQAIWRKERNPNETIRVVEQMDDGSGIMGREMPVFFA